MPQPPEIIPWIDGQRYPQIVLGPCVIEPPGLLVRMASSTPEGPAKLATWGVKGETAYLLETRSGDLPDG